MPLCLCNLRCKTAISKSIFIWLFSFMSYWNKITLSYDREFKYWSPIFLWELLRYVVFILECNCTESFRLWRFQILIPRSVFIIPTSFLTIERIGFCIAHGASRPFVSTVCFKERMEFRKSRLKNFFASRTKPSVWIERRSSQKYGCSAALGGNSQTLDYKKGEMYWRNQ